MIKTREDYEKEIKEILQHVDEPLYGGEPKADGEKSPTYLYYESIFNSALDLAELFKTQRHTRTTAEQTLGVFNRIISNQTILETEEPTQPQDKVELDESMRE